MWQQSKWSLVHVDLLAYVLYSFMIMPMRSILWYYYHCGSAKCSSFDEKIQVFMVLALKCPVLQSCFRNLWLHSHLPPRLESLHKARRTRQTRQPPRVNILYLDSSKFERAQTGIFTWSAPDNALDEPSGYSIFRFSKIRARQARRMNVLFACHISSVLVWRSRHAKRAGDKSIFKFF